MREIDGAGEIGGMVSPVSEAIDWCGSCGNDLRIKARFCDVCGSPVSPCSATSEHKQVTVLFADVVGSMKLASVLDSERFQEIMNELFNRAAAVVQRYQGTVDSFTGDGLMALFGAPVALEDHALRACISAVEIQSVTNNLAAEVLRHDGVALQLRVGLNSGDVIVGEIGSGPGRYTAIGHSVGMAQRMETAAPPGGVLCSLSTARLVEDAARLGSVEDVAIKGADAPVAARQLLAVESNRTVLGRNEGLMLGRDAELDCLRSVFDADRGCLVGIVGDPGVGKSRLINEFTAIAAGRGADIVVARCEAHTTTIAFHALSRLLRAMFEVEGLSDAEAREYTTAQCGGRTHTALRRARESCSRPWESPTPNAPRTAGQRRWPTSPAGRGDGAGRPGSLRLEPFSCLRMSIGSMRPATTSLLVSLTHSMRRHRCSSRPTDRSSTVRCSTIRIRRLRCSHSPIRLRCA